MAVSRELLEGKSWAKILRVFGVGPRPPSQALRRRDNWAEQTALFGDGLGISEMDLPRAKSVLQIPDTARRRLQARAADMTVREHQVCVA